MVTTPVESHQVSRRYLTPFYGITLGLAFLLAIFAMLGRGSVPPQATPATQEVLTQTSSPTLGSTQAIDEVTPTSLPAIPATPNEKTPSPLGVSASDLKGLTVTLWHPWTGSTGAALQAILDEFNRTNRWGFTVEASGYDGFGRLDEAVDTALTSGSLPDVLVDYGYQARHWDESNTFVDLNPYVNDPVWGLTSEEQADFYPNFWAEDEIVDAGGRLVKRLGIPFYRSAYVLFYNQSWGLELGYFNPPATLEDFRLRACAAAEAVAMDGNKSIPGKGGWLVTPQPGALMAWLSALGGSITNAGGQEYRFNTPAVNRAFEYLKGLQASGCAWSETGVDPQSEFANRQALFMVGSLLDIPTQQQAFKQAGNPDEWSVIPFPSDTRAVVDTYGPSLLLTHSNPARQLAAWLTIEWLTYPPNQARWVGTLKAYPTRQSAMNYLGDATNTSPQWAQALTLLPDAQSEPTIASWSVMRWAVSDAMGQLFDLQFGADQIPMLLENLDQVAAEIKPQQP